MDRRETTAAQAGLGDMDVSEFRAAAHAVADRVADYLEGLEAYRVLPAIEPGDVRKRLAAVPPSAPEPFDTILEDYRRIIEPNVTHWQHPGFMAYFPSVASGPGILGEWLAAGLNSNVMFWKNAPASTEVEELVVDWLRRMLGLPDGFEGMLNDTASISSLLALVAARHAVPGLNARRDGLAGGPELRLYVSEEAHSSLEKAAMVIGIGQSGVRKIAVDREFRMRPEALERAIAEDRAAGRVPFCAVATLGTTSSSSVDPAEAIGAICRRERLWFHVDAAYGGAAALLPEKRAMFRGWEDADSVVFNPHKWMFTPFDASLLLFRRAEAFREAFSLVPDYLQASVIGGARNFNEYGVQLGRRFRALKLWMQIRWFGTEGIAARIREHCRLAAALAAEIDAHPDWERLAPVPFATVCFRYRPSSASLPAERLDRLNATILDRVNASGKIYLSHTKLSGKFTLRVSLGNPRAGQGHVDTCWNLLQQSAIDAQSNS